MMNSGVSLEMIAPEMNNFVTKTSTNLLFSSLSSCQHLFTFSIRN
ncbi:hypothetical protein GM3709_1667 [Geminocystis sp. NIES-3709]|nr:hypothetical protein GM3709_1667 [Geminocystis sp. NIES-3709]